MADEKDAGLLLRNKDAVIAHKRFIHDLSPHLTTKNIDELKYLVNLPGMFFLCCLINNIKGLGCTGKTVVK